MILDLPTNHEAVLERVAKFGMKFDNFIDVGAARGSWGPLIRKHWPACSIHYFEAASHWQSELEKQAGELQGEVKVNISAAGNTNGVATFQFDANNPCGGAIVKETSPKTITVPQITLDTYIQQNSIRGRHCLKLDTHGAERMILEGAGQFMRNCDLVIFETYNFGPAHRRFGQMSVFLEETYGLRCFDIAEPKCRPYDNALWQIDLYFIRPEETTLAEWRIV
jgi:FkbM family methyltransferase